MDHTFKQLNVPWNHGTLLVLRSSHTYVKQNTVYKNTNENRYFTTTKIKRNENAIMWFFKAPDGSVVKASISGT